MEREVRSWSGRIIGITTVSPPIPQTSMLRGSILPARCGGQATVSRFARRQVIRGILLLSVMVLEAPLSLGMIHGTRAILTSMHSGLMTTGYASGLWQLIQTV